MAKKQDSGLEQWKRRIEAGEEVAERKPIEEMSPEELDQAIERTKRELLDAQRSELEAHKEEDRRYFSEFVKPRPYWR
jgi:hypothetical protein